MLSGVGCHADLQHPRLLLITSGVSLSLPGMDRAWISWAVACMVIKMDWFSPTNWEHMRCFSCRLSGIRQVSVLWWSVWKGKKKDIPNDFFFYPTFQTLHIFLYYPMYQRKKHNASNEITFLHASHHKMLAVEISFYNCVGEIVNIRSTMVEHCMT